jgi:hypothetical protein
MLFRLLRPIAVQSPLGCCFSDGRLQVQSGRFNHQSTQESFKTTKGYKDLTEETDHNRGSMDQVLCPKRLNKWRS